MQRVIYPSAGGGGGGIAVNSQNLGNIGSSLAVNLQSTSGQVFRVVANTASGTISFTNVVAGAEWIVQHTQDGTGGRVTLFSGVTFLGGAGAVTPAAGAVDVFNFYSPDGTTIYGFQATAPSYTPPFYGSAPAIIETMNRQNLFSKGINAGTQYLTHFRPDHDLTVGNIQSMCTGGAGSGGTLNKMAISKVTGTDTSVNYTTIARTASDTTLWTVSNAYNRRAIVDDGQGNAISTVTLRAGVLYAGSVLQVGGSGPFMGAANGANTSAAVSGPDTSGKLPRLASQLTSQTDIPGTTTGLNVNVGVLLWMAFD